MSDNMPWQAKRLDELNDDLADLLKTKRMILILMVVTLGVQIVGFFREGFDLTFIGMGGFLIALLASIWVDSKFEKTRKEFDEVWETLPESIRNRVKAPVRREKKDDEIL